MRVINFIRALLELFAEFRERKQTNKQETEAFCETCEVLKVQLEASNAEKRMLLQALVAKDVPKTQEPPPPPFIVHGGRHIPLQVRRQMMVDAENAKAAQVLAQKKKEMEDTPSAIPQDEVDTTLKVDIDKLEKEVGISDAS